MADNTDCGYVPGRNPFLEGIGNRIARAAEVLGIGRAETVKIDPYDWGEYQLEAEEIADRWYNNLGRTARNMGRGLVNAVTFPARYVRACRQANEIKTEDLMK